MASIKPFDVKKRLKLTKCGHTIIEIREERAEKFLNKLLAISESQVRAAKGRLNAAKKKKISEIDSDVSARGHS